MSVHAGTVTRKALRSVAFVEQGRWCPVGSTRDFRNVKSRGGSQTAPLTGTLACGCDVDGREPELSKPTPKWWCCGAFQKRTTTREAA